MSVLTTGAIAAVLVLIWLLAIITSHTAGGVIHILPGVAIEALLLQLIVGKDPA